MESVNSLPVAKYGDRTKLHINIWCSEKGDLDCGIMTICCQEVFNNKIDIPFYNDASIRSYICFGNKPNKRELDIEDTKDFCQRAKRCKTFYIHIRNEEGEGTFIFHTKGIDWEKVNLGDEYYPYSE